MTRRLAIIAALLVTVVGLACAPALADVQSVYHGGTYFGSVIVEPGQIVRGDLIVMGGDATIEGVVDGDVNVLGGSVYERPGATITGQVNALGGDVASVVVPWSEMPQYQVTQRHDYKLLWHVAQDVVAILFFLVFPLRTKIALDRLERHPGLCAGIGLLGWVAVIPLAVLLLFTVLLIPFIAVEAVVVIGGVFLGQAALSLLVGRRLCEIVSPRTTPSPFVALLVGLALVTAAELVPAVGIVVTTFVWLIGLGAAILAFTGESLINPPVAVQAPRPPLSGPPMPVG
jgi:hypothetical protein